MKIPARFAFALAFLFGLTTPATVRAQWVDDGAPVCTEIGTQSRIAAVPDGLGGVILVWQDGRAGTNTAAIFAQHLDGAGVPLWATGGIPVCPSGGPQLTPSAAPDGAGGVVVAWHENRSGPYDIYAQRVSASGVLQWGPAGVPVCTQSSIQAEARIVSDGAGGAIIAWEDYRNGISNRDIYAQRVDASGLATWSNNGVPVCTASGEQLRARIAPDGGGGVIITWRDHGRLNVYAQRLDGTGAVQWVPDGATVCGAAGSQGDPVIISDGAGGAYLAWDDSRSGTSGDIYAQRVDANGIGQWTPDGVTVCTATFLQASPILVGDGLGGMVVVWHDYRLGFGNPDLYAQRLGGGGATQWAANGQALSSAAGSQEVPSAASDGAGGVIVTWTDWRTELDIYAQHLDAAGVRQWTANGVHVCALPGYQQESAVVADLSGGAIVAWRDDRTSTASDIYAQRLPAVAAVGVGPNPVAAGERLTGPFPNPTRGAVAFVLRTSGGPQVAASVTDVAGRRVRDLKPREKEPGVYSISWDGRSGSGLLLPTGVYLVHIRIGNHAETRRVIRLRE